MTSTKSRFSALLVTFLSSVAYAQGTATATIPGEPATSKAAPAPKETVKESPKISAAAEAALRRATEGRLTDNDVLEGPRISRFEEQMKAEFPKANVFRQSTILPAEYGGTSLMGLVHRLLGEQVNRDFEGLKTRRYIYRANDDKQPVGLAHASRFGLNSGETVDVVIFYEPTGEIRDLRVQGLPNDTLAALESGGYLKQFIGRSSEDFEVKLGRKGRVKSRAAFVLNAKRPGSVALRSVFEKIMRSVRFNTAFMEVAYFIAQHPEDLTATTPEGPALTSSTR